MSATDVLPRPLDGIARALRQDLSANLPAGAAGLATLIALSERPRVVCLIDAILDDPMALDLVGAWSYFHRNGFYKLVLSRDTHRDSAVRIHFWPADEVQDTPSDIHNHAWDFWSVIMAGTLEFCLYSEAGGSELFHEHRFTSIEATGFDIQYVGTAALGRSLDIRVPAGGNYFLSATSLHAVRHAGACATMILRGPANNPTSRVFGQERHRSAEQRTRRLELDETITTLGRLRALLLQNP